MKEKLEEIKLIVRNDKKYLFVGLFVLAVAVMYLLTDNKKPRKARPASPVANGTQMVADEGTSDIISSFRTQIQEARQDNKNQEAVIGRLTTDFKEHKTRVEGVLESVVDKVEQLNQEIALITSNLKDRQNANDAVPPPQAPLQADGLDVIAPDPPAIPPPPLPPVPNRVTVIAPGDSVECELLSGVNAPVDGTPYPVVFQLAGPIIGPDGSTLPLGEARLIAAAQGSEVDSRALFRLSSLSIRHKSGRRDVVKVDGWIVGEDGIRGMSGRLIDKLGRLILATAGVSFTAALGDQLTGNSKGDFNNRNNNQNPGFYVDNSDVDFAAASALTDASNRLGKLLLDKYESFVPVVEVLASRKAVAVFSQTAEVGILEEDDAEASIVSASYSD